MAQQLGTFVPLVGGPEWAYVLLEPLEALAAMEESTVRDKVSYTRTRTTHAARPRVPSTHTPLTPLVSCPPTVQAVASLNVIIAVLPLATVLSHAWPVLKRLAEKDWFTARTSACGLIARTYARVAGTPASTSAAQEGKEEHAGMEDAIQAAAAAAAAAGNTGPPPTPDDVLALYQRLCGPDEVPMVRRAACVHMADVGTALAGGRLPDPSAAHGHGDGDAEGGSSASDSKHEDSAARGPGGVSASTSSSTSSSAGSAGVVLQVDTGDVSAAAAPPAVPKPVTVSAATQDSGAKAATALMPLLTALMKDEQDSVRLLSVDNCVAAARLVNGGMDSVTTDAPPSSAAAAAQRLAKQPELRQQIMGLMLTLAADKSWRVRWSVANRLGEFAEAVGRAATSASLLPAFQALLTDAEAEVRTAAAYRVAEVGRLVGRDRLQAVILPCVNRLSEDVSEYVRGALATVVLSLAPVLGTDTTIAALLPLFLRLLKDSSAQVRLNIISKLEAVNAVIGLKMLSQALLPAIQELSADKQWRVRQAIIEFTPLLARQLGADFFDATPELVELCVRWLSDSVFAIREAAASNLKKLTEVRYARLQTLLLYYYCVL